MGDLVQLVELESDVLAVARGRDPGVQRGAQRSVGHQPAPAVRWERAEAARLSSWVRCRSTKASR